MRLKKIDDKQLESDFFLFIMKVKVTMKWWVFQTKPTTLASTSNSVLNVSVSTANGASGSNSDDKQLVEL